MVKQVKKFLDKALEMVLMICVAVLVIDVLWQVFTRKILQNPSKWTEEIAIFLLIWVALLGAAVALSLGAHLGIDYFVGKLSKAKRIFTEMVVFLLILSFSVYVMLYGGYDLVSSTFELGQVSPALGLKMGYVYLAVPISGFFMMIYSFLGMCERINALSGKEAQQ
jgi:TRAP-type C4-dicarboxylate transport system permease small subunit